MKFQKAEDKLYIYLKFFSVKKYKTLDIKSDCPLLENIL